MRHRFMNLLTQKFALPEEALKAFDEAERRLFSDPFALKEAKKLRFLYFSSEYEEQPFLDALDKLAETIDIHRFTLHMLFLMFCADLLRERYAEKGVPEWIYWNTIDDLKYKIRECHEVNGIWGTFVFGWFHGFYDMTRFALGRLQYDITTLKFPPWDNEKLRWKIDAFPPFKKDGAALNIGDKVYNVHIPSSGPLTRDLRMESYKLAYNFFGMRNKGRPLPLICTSWILYPGQREFLPPHSNTISFMKDFDIVAYFEVPVFDNAWRVFGKDHTLPPNKLPRETSMQKAYADRLMEGKPTGTGMGILFFDGEKIL